MAMIIGGRGAAGEARPATGPPAGLTPAGRNLWNFEALLQDVFHSKSVIVKGDSLNFETYPAHAGAAGPPQSAFAWYQPVFADASDSAFHLSNRAVRNGEFGNYLQLIRIAGHPVACNPGETRFLITYGDALDLDLACMKPSP